MGADAVRIGFGASAFRRRKRACANRRLRAGFARAEILCRLDEIKFCNLDAAPNSIAQNLPAKVAPF